MNTKNVSAVMAPASPHFVGDGFRVHNFIPGNPQLHMQRMDPFIMLDYNSKYNFPAAPEPRGVGVHPHRGFETVTIAYKGRVEHHDSAGGGGVIGEGDVQWMTAASGVLHKEHHEKEWAKQGGEFQMVQLWVNLPAKDKMSTPKYQAIENSQMVRVDAEKDGYIELIAGQYKEATGPASTFTPIHMMNAKLNKGGKANFDFPANYTTLALVIEGEILINGSHKVGGDHLALFDNKGSAFEMEATENAVVLILSGLPIAEPIFAHGPFVMNNRDEIVQAFEDYNTGKFGYLED